MTILYLFRSLAVWGGIERILIEKMNFLVQEYDMDIYLLTSDQGQHPIPYHLDDNVKREDLGINFHHRYRYGLFKRLWVGHQKTILYERLLHSRIQTIKPDVIICTTSDPVSSIVKVKGSIPLIIESHSICSRTINQGKFWFLRIVNRFTFLKAISKVQVVVALTEGDAAEWRKYHPNVVVIPNFISRESEEQASLESKHVIFVGRFDYQKRVLDALSIWEEVFKRFPDWILDIYGEGEMKDEIESRVSNMKNVILHQPTDKIYDCYRNSSVLILTSLFEPFGLVILEAMSCGLPVVAYDCPYGPASIITDGHDGFLVPNQNKNMFVDKVCSLLSDFDLRCQMGSGGRKSSVRYYPECIVPQWLSLFLQCIKENVI